MSNDRTQVHNPFMFYCCRCIGKKFLLEMHSAKTKTLKPSLEENKKKKHL